MSYFYSTQYNHLNTLKNAKDFKIRKIGFQNPKWHLKIKKWLPAPCPGCKIFLTLAKTRPISSAVIQCVWLSPIFGGKLERQLLPSSLNVHDKRNSIHLNFCYTPICFDSWSELFVAIWGQTTIQGMAALHRAQSPSLSSLQHRGPWQGIQVSWRAMECIKSSSIFSCRQIWLLSLLPALRFLTISAIKTLKARFGELCLFNIKALIFILIGVPVGSVLSPQRDPCSKSRF